MFPLYLKEIVFCLKESGLKGVRRGRLNTSRSEALPDWAGGCRGAQLFIPWERRIWANDAEVSGVLSLLPETGCQTRSQPSNPDSPAL